MVASAALHVIAWLLARLPALALVPIGWLCGIVVVPCLRRRRRIIARNLALAFPGRAAANRGLLQLCHHAMLGRFALEHALLIHGSAKRLRRFVRVKNEQVLRELAGRPVILIAQHFVGLNQGFARLSLDHALIAPFAPQRSARAEKLIARSRTHLGGANAMLVSNKEPTMLRALCREIRAGRLAYILNDMDQNLRGHAAFLPFCAVADAATPTTLPRLAKLTGAAVVPCQSVALPWGGYEVRLEPAWDNFPTDDPVADMHRYNDHTSALIAAAPAQYYWPHRRFKTRPPGEESPYG